MYVVNSDICCLTISSTREQFTALYFVFKDTNNSLNFIYNLVFNYLLVYNVLKKRVFDYLKQVIN